LKEILGDVPEQYRAIDILLNRVALIGAENLAEQVAFLIARRLGSLSPEEARDWIDRLLVTCLDTIRDKKGNVKSALNVTLILELADWAQLGLDYPANHPKVQTWINTKLLQLRAKEMLPASGNLADAFGFPMSPLDSTTPFPSPRIEVLGDVKLRSMFREKPCQTRYGRIESASYPVGFATREKMKNSLRWLGSIANKNCTWTNVSGFCGFRRGLAIPSVLLAYPANLPAASQIELAALFGGADPLLAESADGEARFTAIASRIIKACHSIVVERPDAEVRIMVLSKADQTSSRVKLVLSRHCTATRICAAAEEWQAGSQNIPRIALNIGTGKGEKANWIVPLTPFPTEVVGCLNIIWYRDATHAEQVAGVNIGDGLSLLLETPPYIVQTANTLLGGALRNTSTLLLALGHADHRGDGSFAWTKGTKPYAQYARLLPCILGLLLDKFGHKKGDYMHTPSFLVGQMMSLADTLHKEYCLAVRASRKKDKSAEKEQGSGTGGLPRQLIGNAAMNIAMDNPTAALARLAERILIYQAWANTASGDIGYAGWALAEYRRISAELGKMLLPDRCADPDKAQMLLGYLSRIGAPKDNAGDNNGSATSTGSEEQRYA
jgi:hypothetical protein